jgi:hypothetical protein
MRADESGGASRKAIPLTQRIDEKASVPFMTAAARREIHIL